MKTADSSVVVAAFAPWHEAHSVAARAIRDVDRLPAHVVLETYSLLTRLPQPHRAPASVVREFLARDFPRPPLTIPPKAYGDLLRRLAEGGITGGGAYDALIAAVAAAAGATLLTRDVRAARTYEVMGADVALAR